MQALVDRHRQFVDNTLTNGKPVKFTQDGRDVIKLPGPTGEVLGRWHNHRLIIIVHIVYIVCVVRII